MSFWTSLVCSFCEIAMTSVLQFLPLLLKNILVQAERVPQINPANFLVGRERGGSTAPKDNPIVHDVCPVSNAQSFTHVVIGDQHADAALLQVEDDVLNVSDGDRIDPREGLVEQDKPWGDD